MLLDSMSLCMGMKTLHPSVPEKQLPKSSVEQKLYFWTSDLVTVAKMFVKTSSEVWQCTMGKFDYIFSMVCGNAYSPVYKIHIKQMDRFLYNKYNNN